MLDNEDTLTPVIVFYIGVGNLSPASAEAFVERMTTKLGEKPKGWQRYILPIRSYESRVEVFYPDQIKGKAKKYVRDITPIKNDVMKTDTPPSEEYWTDFREKIKDHVLLFLGAPVVKVELDKQHIDECYDFSMSIIDAHFKSKYGFSAKEAANFPTSLFKELALGYASEILWKIRSKFIALQGHKDGLCLHEQKQAQKRIDQATQDLKKL